VKKGPRWVVEQHCHRLRGREISSSLSFQRFFQRKKKRGADDPQSATVERGIWSNNTITDIKHPEAAKMWGSEPRVKGGVGGVWGGGGGGGWGGGGVGGVKKKRGGKVEVRQSLEHKI